MPDSDSLDHTEIKSFYDEKYYGKASEHIRPSGHLKKLAIQLEINSETEILDIACGTGNWLLAASQAGASPAGIDLSETAINICRKNIPQGEFHIGPAETLPFEDNSFNLVTCLGSLEHFLDPESALKEMVRVAKEDAQFLILVPNAGFLTRRLGLYSGTQQASIKEEVLPLEDWNRLFESAGLQVIKRWKDLHVLSWRWISNEGWKKAPLRFAQAILLPLWPLNWQYQVYHLLKAAEK